MTSQFSSLTHADIQRWVGPASFQKGQSYFSSGAIFNPRCQGQTLKARCRGSQASSYQLQVTLGPEGIVSADCSCPVGAGGRCKHVAALLLTWLDEPDSFQEVEDLQAALEKRSQAELIALIRQMIQREPDLEILLEMPLPGTQASQEPLDPEIIRRQVEHAFGGSKGDWEMGWADPYDIVQELETLLDLAEQYQAKGNPSNAAIIYRVMAETILDNDEAVMQDEDGQLGSVVGECSEDLGKCLDAITDPAQRESLLETLCDVYAWDVRMGGIGIGDAVPVILLEQTTPQERQTISGWIEARLSMASDWGRQALGGLQLELQADTLDDESFLQISRQTGRLADLVDRLLALGRVDEAEAEARQAGDFDLLNLADLFDQHAHGPLAQTLLRERSQTSQDTRLTEWLKEYAKKQGDLPEALALAERLFWLRPSVPAFVDIRQLATPQEQWPERRLRLLSSLTQQGQHALLTEIYLEEGEIDKALDALEKAKATQRYLWGLPDQIRVAAAAREKRPREAIRLYLEEAQHLIDHRGRENYAQAAEYLRQVRDLYQRLGEPQAWQEVVTQLREQHRALRAFQDELRKAGL